MIPFLRPVLASLPSGAASWLGFLGLAIPFTLVFGGWVGEQITRTSVEDGLSPASDLEKARHLREVFRRVAWVSSGVCLLMAVIVWAVG